MHAWAMYALLLFLFMVVKSDGKEEWVALDWETDESKKELTSTSKGKWSACKMSGRCRE